MLADAIAAEAYKFRRNSNTLFWGFFFVPMAVLAFDLLVDSYLKLRSSGITLAIAAAAGMTHRFDIGPQILHAIALGGSSFIQIFFVVGAAGIFASEYRWETWRLLTPRNSRANLLAAKYLVYAGACAASLTALGLAAALQTLYDAMLYGSLPAMPGADFAGQALGMFAATWAELLVLGAFTALVTVASRAAVGALMAGVVFSFAQTIAMAIVHPWEAPLQDFALLPSMSAYLLRAWALGSEVAPGIFADPGKALPAAGFLAAWIAVLVATAIGLFRIQDLPRE